MYSALCFFHKVKQDEYLFGGAILVIKSNRLFIFSFALTSICKLFQAYKKLQK